MAILDPRGSHTYSDLDRRSAEVAATLLDGRNDLHEARVAFQIAPGFDHVAVHWGIARRCIAVPLPMDYTEREVEYLIRDADVSAVFAHREHVLTLESRDEIGPAHVVAPDRRAMILYTSGTTGQPKGVVITHASLTAQIESLVAAWEWTASDRTLLVLPFIMCTDPECRELRVVERRRTEMHPRSIRKRVESLASGELTLSQPYRRSITV